MNLEASCVTKHPKFLPIKQCHVDGNSVSIFDLIADAISCSVVQFMIASWAADIANSCIRPCMKVVFTTGLAL
jgi:hypothetical protein